MKMSSLLSWFPESSFSSLALLCWPCPSPIFLLVPPLLPNLSILKFFSIGTYEMVKFLIPFTYPSLFLIPQPSPFALAPTLFTCCSALKSSLTSLTSHISHQLRQQLMAALRPDFTGNLTASYYLHCV